MKKERRTTMRHILRRASSASLILALSCAAAAAQDAPKTDGKTVGKTDALRICADPSNLPFSSDDPARPGLNVEIGRLVADALHRPVSYVWYRTDFGKRAVRVTMLSNQCDMTIGLPQDSDFMGPRVIFSQPLYRSGYVVVLPQGKKFAAVDDLKGDKVAVQFSTGPQGIVAARADMEGVTVLSPEEGMARLADGKADAAFLWGPSAGYLNQTVYSGRFQLFPVDGQGLSWPTSIGFAKQNTALRDQVDAVLPGLKEPVAALLQKYGAPPAQAIRVNARESATRVAAADASGFAAAARMNQPPAAAQIAQAAQPAPGAAAAAAPAAPDEKVIAEGKEIFNGTCSHCHGPDAVQSEKKIDLRRLTIRYDADMRNVFWKTVHEGRPSKGMPSWKDVFTDDQFEKIFAFLQTVQSKE
ncbi:MAG: transporter substrate-binding domain-containing protein [Hyphomicrobiales bacterium]|nr:transporter substrate-binding domain-containing protein [Hyphomicrobiales bacterium]